MKDDLRPLIKGMLSAFLILIGIMLFLVAITACSQKVHHRPRYNHWAKPYELYAPVKTHKPNLK